MNAPFTGYWRRVWSRWIDRVVVLKQRVIFDGPPAELAASGVSLGVHREDLPLWLEGLR